MNYNRGWSVGVEVEVRWGVVHTKVGNLPKGAVHERRKVAERGLTEGPGAPGETRRRDWAAQRNGIARGEEWRCQGQGESGNGRRKFLGISFESST